MFWCGRGDLNPHAFRRHPLKMVCLPVPPLPHLFFSKPLYTAHPERQIPLSGMRCEVFRPLPRGTAKGVPSGIRNALNLIMGKLFGRIRVLRNV